MADQGIQQVNVFNPEGDLVSIPQQQMEEAQQAGYRPAQPEEVNQFFKEQKYGTPGQTAQAAGEALLKGSTFGASTGIATKVFGIDPEELRAREEANPIASTIGEIAGIANPFGPEGKLLSIAGKGAAAKLGFEGAGLASKIGDAATRGAVETGLVQSGDEVHKMFAQDPNQSVQTAITNIGLASMMGGALGAGLGGTSHLWEQTGGAKLKQYLEAVKNRVDGNAVSLPMNLGEAIERSQMEIAPEIKTALSQDPEFQRMYAQLQESTTRPGLEAQKGLQEFRKTAADNVVSAFGKKPEEIIPYGSLSPYEVGTSIQDNLAKQVEKDFKPLSDSFNKIKGQFSKISLSQADDTIADRLGQLAQQNGWTMPSLPQTKLINEVMTDIPHIKTLGDLTKYQSDVWAKIDMLNPQMKHAAGQIVGLLRNAENNILEREAGKTSAELAGTLKLTREAYGQKAALMEDLADKLSLGKFRGPDSIVHAIRDATPESLLSKLTKANDAGLLQLVQKEFPQIADQAKEYLINKTLSQASAKALEGHAINTKTLFNTLDKMSPEMKSFMLPTEAESKINATRSLIDSLPQKMNPSGTAKTLDTLWSQVPAGAAGLASLLLGHSPIIGAILGTAAKWLVRDVPDALRLGFLKFLGHSGPVNPKAFRALVDYAAAVYKGESSLNKTIGGLFKGAALVAPRFKLPSEQDNKKLDKMVIKYNQDPSQLLKSGGDSVYYLPDHAPAMSQTASQAVQYLNSLRPKTDKLGILDDNRVPSVVEKAKYDRALTIANQPLVVFQHIKSGTLTQDDVVAVRTMYPSLYQRMHDKILSQINDHVSDGNKISYPTRINLAMFLMQPLDSSMSAQAIQMNQTQDLTNGQGPQSQQAPSSKGPHSYKALNKVSQQFQTIDQARALQKLQKGMS